MSCKRLLILVCISLFALAAGAGVGITLLRAQRWRPRAAAEPPRYWREQLRLELLKSPEHAAIAPDLLARMLDDQAPIDLGARLVPCGQAACDLLERNASIARQAEPELLRMLNNPDPAAQLRAVDVLGGLSDEQSTQGLFDQILSRGGLRIGFNSELAGSETALAAANAIERHGAEAYGVLLKALYPDKQTPAVASSTREAALVLIERLATHIALPDAQAAPALAAAVGQALRPPAPDGVIDVGDSEAEVILRALGPAAAAAAPDVVRCLDMTLPETRSTLVAMGPHALPSVCKLLSSDDCDVALAAASVIADAASNDGGQSALATARTNATSNAAANAGANAARNRPGKPPMLDLSDEIHDDIHQAAQAAARFLGKPVRSRRSHEQAVSVLAKLIAARPRELSEAIALLHERSPSAQLAGCDVIARLGAAGKEAVPDLIALMRSSAAGGDEQREMAARAEAALALGCMGPAAQGAIPDLIAQFDDPQWQSFDALAEALRCIGPSARRPLCEALKHVSLRAQIGAATALGLFGSDAKDAIGLLIEAGRRPSVKMRLAVAKSLGEMGPAARDALSLLIEMLQSEDADLRAAAADALGDIGPFAAGNLAGQIEQAEKDAVEATVGGGGGGEGFAMQPRAQSSAAAGGVAGDAAMVSALTTALRDRQFRVRGAAVAALAKFGPAASAALPQLQCLLKDPALHDAVADAILLITLRPAN